MTFQGLLSNRIRTKLPILLQDEAFVGRFVVFRHGKVHAVGDTYEAAYSKALTVFGANSPFYVGFVGPAEANSEVADDPAFAALG